MAKQKKLSWKPVHRPGGIYCSSACGRGCTAVEHSTAHRQAQDALVRLTTPGWVIRVWENMGWHWCLINRHCGISLNFEPRTQKYWSMMATGNVKMVSHGSCHLTQGHYYSKDPNKVVAEQIKIAESWYQDELKGYEGLKKLKAVKITYHGRRHR